MYLCYIVQISEVRVSYPSTRRKWFSSSIAPVFQTLQHIYLINVELHLQLAVTDLCTLNLT
jgi:hypothetical protein